MRYNFSIKILIVSILLFISELSPAQNIFNAEDFNLSIFKKINNFNNSPVISRNGFNSVSSSTVTPVNVNTVISNFITDILLNGDTVWFATGNGIMRTVNHFNSFQSFEGVAPFGNDDISGFNLNRDIIAAATAIGEEVNGSSVPKGTGIKVSTDNGLNWIAYPQPVDGRGDSIITYGSNTLYALPVVVTQQNLTYDIAITKTQNDP